MRWFLLNGLGAVEHRLAERELERERGRAVVRCRRVLEPGRERHLCLRAAGRRRRPGTRPPAVHGPHAHLVGGVCPKALDPLRRARARVVSVQPVAARPAVVHVVARDRRTIVRRRCPRRLQPSAPRGQRRRRGCVRHVRVRARRRRRGPSARPFGVRCPNPHFVGGARRQARNPLRRACAGMVGVKPVPVRLAILDVVARDRRAVVGRRRPRRLQPGAPRRQRRRRGCVRHVRVRARRRRRGPRARPFGVRPPNAHFVGGARRQARNPLRRARAGMIGVKPVPVRLAILDVVARDRRAVVRRRRPRRLQPSARWRQRRRRGCVWHVGVRTRGRRRGPGARPFGVRRPNAHLVGGARRQARNPLRRACT